MIKNLIFDLDGTLATTHQDIISSLNHALSFMNIKKKINKKIFINSANKGSKYMIMQITKLGNKKINKINTLFLNHYKNNICVKSKIKKNLESFLKYSRRKKIKLFVSTNKSEKNSKILLKKLKILKYFKFVIGYDTFQYKKPDPKHLKYLQKKFPFKKDETIMIGDSEIDFKLAKKFNIRFIFVRNGYTNKSSLEKLSEHHFSNYTKLIKILKKLN